MDQLVTEPTQKGGGTLDHVIICESDIDVVSDISVGPHAISDHCPVIVTIKQVMAERQVRRTLAVRPVSAVVASDFAQDIQESSLSSISDNDVSSMVSCYNAQLRLLLDKHAPVRNKSVVIRQKVPWYNAEVRTARSERRRAESTWRQSRLEVHREIYKSKHVQVVRKIEAAKVAFFNGKILESESDSCELFKTVNTLLNRKKNTALPVHGSEQQLANRFAHFFDSKIQKINLELANVRASCHHTYVNSGHSECLTRLSEFDRVTEEELTKIIRASPTKSCSLDPLPTSLLKDGPVFDTMLPILCKIVNTSLSTGLIPHDLKHAMITPLLKKKGLDGDNLKNYRPVSNLTFLSKLVERVVTKRIQDHMSKAGLFEKMQSAYRSNHSTETALVRVMNDLLCAVDKKQKVGLVLLDLSAAFDTVNHAVLLERLRESMGIEGTALQWFESYLSDRFQSVSVSGVTSDRFKLTTGVPQGSVLGPLLFTIYMSPLADLIKAHGLIAHFYADDTQIYICFRPAETSSAMSSLEECIEDVRAWMAHNFLKLNDDKSEFLVVSSRFDRTPVVSQLSVKIGEHTIKAATLVRNIGAFFDEHLSMTRHVNIMCKNAFFHLHQIGLVRKFLTFKAAERVIHSLVTSRLDYLNALLVGLPSQDIAKLQRVQNCAARLLSGQKRAEHITPVLNELHWLRVKDRIEFKILLLCFKCLNGFGPL